MAEEETSQEWLERNGVAKVRLLLVTEGVPVNRFPDARNWLAQKEEEERARNETRQSEQMAVTLSANRAAWIAAGASILAVVFGIIAVVISYLAWIYPVR